MPSVDDFFPSKYLSAEDLQGRDHTLTIQRIEADELTNQTGQTERKMILYFQGAKKGLVMNKTNTMTVAHMYGKDYTQWVGKEVTLGSTWIEAFGEQKFAVRIRPGLEGGALTGQPIDTQEVVQNTADAMQAPNGGMVPATGPADIDDEIPF